MSNIVPFEQQLVLARSFVKSGLFGIKTEDQALALMALCEAEGMHPARAVQEFHIVQGRPAMKADAMLARFQRAGGRVEWNEYSDTSVSGTFSHPQGGSVRIDWTMKQAADIGLAGKDNWKNYPRAMLRSRCISEGVRTVFPGIASGVYTVEEMQDMPAPPPPPKNMGTAEVVEPPSYPAETFDANLPNWRSLIDAGKATAAQIIAKVETKGKLTDEQKAKLTAPAAEVVEG